MNEKLVQQIIDDANRVSEHILPLTRSCFMLMRTTDTGDFFIGRPPIPGEAVEMVCTGSYIDGQGMDCLRFMLRVKP